MADDRLHLVAEGQRAAVELPARITGECFYCEDTAAQFVVQPAEGKAVRVRCERCGAVTEIERD